MSINLCYLSTVYKIAVSDPLFVWRPEATRAPDFKVGHPPCKLLHFLVASQLHYCLWPPPHKLIIAPTHLKTPCAIGRQAECQKCR